jgi:hypothetical protein
MFDLNPSAARVSVDGATGRPRSIRSHGERFVVTALEAVRDETAAYPLDSGPRTVFVVRAQERRYRLVHLLRESRWTVEELAPREMGLADAA